MLRSWLQTPRDILDTPSFSATAQRLRPMAPSDIPSINVLPVQNLEPQYDKTAYFTSLERRVRELEQQLQQLLDAQADALLSNFQTDKDDGQANIPETSRSSQTSASGKVTPVRQPKPRKIGVMEARRGIRDSMQELWDVKAEQARLLGVAITQVQRDKGTISSWESKRDALQKEMETLSIDQESTNIESLREENNSILEQIRETELILSELKSRQRAISSQLTRLDNSFQSKLSSYKASLSSLDQQVEGYLRRPEPAVMISKSEDSPFLSLPPARRTTRLALEYLEDEGKNLRAKQDSTIIEQEALDDGLNLWRDTVKTIMKLERHLRRLLKNFRTSETFSDNFAEDTETDGTADLFSQTISHVEKNIRTAQEKGWTLLVCAIGAELEALGQGATMLPGSFSIPSNTVSDTTSLNDISEIEDQEPADTFKTAENTPSSVRMEKSNSRRSRIIEDDEPPIELLIGKQDTDTE